MVHTFPKSISPKVNVIAQLGYKLAYSEPTFKFFIHYATGTSP